jgi:hypothetical protein
MSEARLTSIFLKILQKFGYWTYKINDRIRSGIPDAVVIRDGRVTFIEFKVGTPPRLPKLLRPAQLWTLRELAQTGVNVRILLFDGTSIHYLDHEFTLLGTRARNDFSPELL